MLDERGRRRFAAAEAISAGHGGVSAVMRATGIARSTIGRGLAELRAGESPDAGPRAPAGRRPQAAERDRCEPARRSARAGRAGDARRSAIAAAVDVQEPAQAQPELARHGPQDRPHAGRRAAAQARLQSASQPQDARGIEPSRSRRAVPLHQRSGEGSAGGGRAGDLGRHQEEGTGRRFQERRTRMAAAGLARGGSRARFCHPRNLGGRCPMASTTWPTTPAG